MVSAGHLRGCCGVPSPGNAFAGRPNTTEARSRSRFTRAGIECHPSGIPNRSTVSLSDPLLSRTIIYALVDLRAPGDFSHRDIITLSTADARILTIWLYGQNRTAGDWILWTMHPLHSGTLWGIFFKLIWAFCGLALAILPITGLLMYWNRFLRHQL
jgi:hypothetical protein